MLYKLEQKQKKNTAGVKPHQTSRN